MVDICLSDSEKLYVVHGVQLGMREDGRNCSDFRNIQLEINLLDSCSGSARIRLANTYVLVGVKCEIAEPSISRPNHAAIHFSVDCCANATPSFEGKGGDDLANSIATSLAESYNFSDALDLASFCLIPGLKTWHIYVDILILEVGGNVFDAISLAVKAALHCTKICKVQVVAGDGCNADLEISDDPFNAIQLDATNSPLLITAFKIGSSEVVDASLEEESCSNAKLVVGVGVNGECCLVRKFGQASLHPGSIEDMIRMSCEVGSLMHERLGAALESQRYLKRSSSTNLLLHRSFIN